MSFLKLSKLVALLSCVCVLSAGVAHAAPRRPALGPFIDEAYYQGQTKCSPWAKPGVVAFQRLVLAAYPGTGAGSISRACSVGGTSEHKEGRAWDWGVNVSNAAQKAAADDLLAWLARSDGYGNSAAMARRLGVMYAIWNRRIWFPSSGWKVYCVQRNGACRDPQDGDIRHPHTDHVHFSFTRRGAYKRTTYWKPATTYASGAAASPWGGIWAAGRNGGIRILGSAGYYGSRASRLKGTFASAVAARPAGDGYWLLTKKGRVFAFGAARQHGFSSEMRGIDIASTPSGKGYWILSPAGRVAAFGDAQRHGRVPSTEGPVVAMAPTTTGAGYWVLAASGKVFAFGDAEHLGNAAQGVVDIAAHPAGTGYWVVTAAGSVAAFGEAGTFEPPASPPASPVVELVPTTSGSGYWLVTRKAAAKPVGDASMVRAAYSAMTTSFEADRVLDLIAE